MFEELEQRIANLSGLDLQDDEQVEEAFTIGDELVTITERVAELMAMLNWVSSDAMSKHGQADPKWHGTAKSLDDRMGTAIDLFGKEVQPATPPDTLLN